MVDQSKKKHPKKETGLIKVKFSIGAKLVSITTLVLFLALGTITAMVWVFMSIDVQQTAIASNADINKQSALSAETSFRATQTNISVLVNDLEKIAASEQTARDETAPDDAAAKRDAAQRGSAATKDAPTQNDSAAQTLDTTPSDSALSQNTRAQNLADFFFKQNPDIVAIAILKSPPSPLPENDDASSSPVTYLNLSFFQSRELSPSLVDSSLAAHFANNAVALSGDNVPDNAAGTAVGITLANVSPDFNGAPILAMGLPASSGAGAFALVFFSAEKLTEIFGTGANSSMLLDQNFDTLVHPDSEVMNEGANLRDDVTELLAKEEQQGFEAGSPWRPYAAFAKKVYEQARAFAQNLLFDINDWVNSYTDAGMFVERIEVKPRFIVASQNISLSYLSPSSPDYVVITTIPEKVVFEGINATTRRNLYLSLSVWFLGILIIWFFSKSISRPLKALKDAAEMIEDGQYHIDIKNKNRDETGVLTASVISMSHVLGNFEKFTNKVIARLSRKGKLEAGGTTKQATIFFSDIRAFTAISEKLSPEEIVEFLNDYMDRMVACVLLTGGTIDKFIGDAVMAHWGAVESAGSPEQDALNGVRAALMMRAALRSFNHSRGGDKKPIIKIGCGLNSGSVVTGQIGSDERLEFTVIGDAVSFADRTETFNKPFGTEILITENTWKLVGKYLIAEEMPPVTEKGQKVRMFAVINMKDSDEAKRILADLDAMPKTEHIINRHCVGIMGPRTLTQVRTFLGTPTPDLSKVNTDEEEKKYSVKKVIVDAQ
jgi:adenylate cyclase